MTKSQMEIHPKPKPTWHLRTFTFKPKSMVVMTSTSMDKTSKGHQACKQVEAVEGITMHREAKDKGKAHPIELTDLVTPNSTGRYHSNREHHRRIPLSQSM